MSFPTRRMRRLRQSESIRRLVRETSLTTNDLIYPLFVTRAKDYLRPLSALPGVNLLSGDPLVKETLELKRIGIPAVLMFGVLEDGDKDEQASLAFSPDGPVQRAIRRIKQETPELTVIADLCLCEYTVSGDCGLVRNGQIDNDATLESLARAAASLAEAGADVIAPSSMMDGMVQAIRAGLDSAGFINVLTMPYSAKFASGFYGPFKAASNSNAAEGKHATHQLDPANARQAMEEMRLDMEEGADMLIVKPALGYLDVLAEARRNFDVPIAAYNVSGEYNMILALAGDDIAYREQLMMETLISIRRAGADMIITYFAPEAARVLSR